MWVNLYLSIGLSILIVALGKALIGRLLARWPKVATWVGADAFVAVLPVFIVLLMIFKPFFPA